MCLICEVYANCMQFNLQCDAASNRLMSFTGKIP